MKIFKFGGASIKDAEGVKNITHILQSEGIENTTQFNDAIKRSCHVFQGYFLDKPLNVRDWRAKLPGK